MVGCGGAASAASLDARSRASDRGRFASSGLRRTPSGLTRARAVHEKIARDLSIFSLGGTGANRTHNLLFIGQTLLPLGYSPISNYTPLPLILHRSELRTTQGRRPGRTAYARHHVPARVGLANTSRVRGTTPAAERPNLLNPSTTRAPARGRSAITSAAVSRDTRARLSRNVHFGPHHDFGRTALL